MLFRKSCTSGPNSLSMIPSQHIWCSRWWWREWYKWQPINWLPEWALPPKVKHGERKNSRHSAETLLSSCMITRHLLLQSWLTAHCLNDVFARLGSMKWPACSPDSSRIEKICYEHLQEEDLRQWKEGWLFKRKIYGIGKKGDLLDAMLTPTKDISKD